MTKPLRVACIGEVMIELSPAGADTARIGVAGDTYNTAVYLARLLGDTGQVSYVTALGDDAQSDRIAHALESEGLRTELVARIPGMMPGLYMISVDDRGERSFSYWRSAAAARSLFGPLSSVQPGDLSGFDLVYLSAISVAILPQPVRDALFDWAVGYRAAGGWIGFDSNYRPRLWEDVDTAQREVMRFWSISDIALPSVDDEMALFGDPDADVVAARIIGAGVRFGALKRGEAGPMALDGSGQALPVTPVKTVVDTTAAGDSFNAGFLAAHLTGAALPQAMAAGAELATRVIQYRGAILPK